MISTTNTELKLGDFKINLTKQIGSGAFGEIYSGINIKTGDEVATKIESVFSRNLQLSYEYKVLKYLQGGVGIPKVYNFFVSDDKNCMIMDLMGLSIESLIKSCKRSLSMKTVLMLAVQMISRVEYVHSKQIIHRDIKPENFLMGKGKNSHQVYIIDFGLAKRYRDPKTNEHIPMKEGKSLIGTARYASIYAHLGYEQSRRDDMEALGYVLMYLLRGSLPWQSLSAKNKKDKYQIIMEKKCATGLDALCMGNVEFVNYFHNVKALGFQEKPEYSYLKSLFENLFDRYNFENDYNYDWNYLGSSKNLKQVSIEKDNKSSTKEDISNKDKVTLSSSKL